MRRAPYFPLLLWLALALPCFGANSPRNFGGVGIDGVPWADGSIVVKQLVAGGPAHLAGIRPGDIVTHIDGKATKGSNFNEMVHYRLRGLDGTKVTLRIRRPGSAAPLTFTLTRRQMTAPGGKR